MRIPPRGKRRTRPWSPPTGTQPPPALVAGVIGAVAADGKVTITETHPPQGGSGTITRTLHRSTIAQQIGVAVGAVTLPHEDLGRTNGVTVHHTIRYTDAAGQFADSNQTTATPQAPASGGGDTLVIFDNFGTGDFSKTGGGFAWGAGGGDAESFVSTINPPPGGTHSIHFVYPAQPLDGDWSVERHFHLPSMPRVAIRFKLYIPPNYFVRNRLPYNNKLLALWGDQYGVEGSTSILCVFEIERTDDLSAHVRIVRWDDGYLHGYGSGTAEVIGEMVVYAQHRGTWLDCRFEITPSSGPGATDGVVRVWRNGQLIDRRTGRRFYVTGGDNLFKNGYVMGWANSGFDQATTLQVADFELHRAVPASWES